MHSMENTKMVCLATSVSGVAFKTLVHISSIIPKVRDGLKSMLAFKKLSAVSVRLPDLLDLISPVEGYFSTKKRRLKKSKEGSKAVLWLVGDPQVVPAAEMFAKPCFTRFQPLSLRNSIQINGFKQEDKRWAQVLWLSISQHMTNNGNDADCLVAQLTTCITLGVCC